MKNELIRRPAGDKTREAILKAAFKLFCNKGFSATSLIQIATAAKINKSLIIHHFESKENLWRQVKASFLHTIPELEFPDPNIEFIEFINTIVTQRFMLYDKNPNIARMISWQRLEKDSANLEGTDKKLFEHYTDIIKNYQNQGIIRNDFDAKFIVLWISISVSGIFLTKEKPFKSQEQKLAYKDMVIKSIISTLSTSNA